jgi:hypothetical protein
VDDQILGAVNANMLASVRLARAAVLHMRANRWGRVCFIASATVRQPLRDLTLSNVARTGLWAWAKTAAQDLAEEGITVNLPCPGLHATDRLLERGTTGRTGDPGDFGKVVAFLCSQRRTSSTGSPWASTAARSWACCRSTWRRIGGRAASRRRVGPVREKAHHRDLTGMGIILWSSRVSLGSVDQGSGCVRLTPNPAGRDGGLRSFGGRGEVWSQFIALGTYGSICASVLVERRARYRLIHG